MRIVTVVGARPQFIKAAVVSHVLRNNHTEILVHTGQHYDYNMSAQFFEVLSLPEPDYQLGISGGTHAQMTGKMMIAIEEVLLKEKPDALLVYGDTNSTLAAALAAVKLHVPVCHVEAGNRAGSLTSPEEVNRICADHVAALRLCSNQSSVENLAREGLTGYFVGNTMYDAFTQYRNAKKPQDLTLTLLEGGTASVPEEYYYLTCHREENTRNDEALTEILSAMERLDAPVVYPVHPRNKQRALTLKAKCGLKNIILAEPVSYVDSICLVSNAKKVVTDSGGVQTEAFFAGVKCVTIFDYVVWPETMKNGRNVLSRPNAEEILRKLAEPQKVDASYQPFGDGHSAEKIVRHLEAAFMKREEL